MMDDRPDPIIRETYGRLEPEHPTLVEWVEWITGLVKALDDLGIEPGDQFEITFPGAIDEFGDEWRSIVDDLEWELFQEMRLGLRQRLKDLRRGVVTLDEILDEIPERDD